MKVLKKILKIGGFAMLAVLLAFVLFPFVFKDKIISSVKNAINDAVNADVEFGAVDMSVWKSFPQIYISVDDLSITGIDTFDGLSLLKTERLDIDFSFWSLIGKNSVPAITHFGLKNPEINILVLNPERANYMISKTDSDTTGTGFRLVLESYAIANGKLTYKDIERDMLIRISGLDHTGKGDFTQDVFLLDTKSAASSLDLSYGGTNYLSGIRTVADVKLDVNVPENKYTLTENIAKLNELELKLDGFVQLNDDDVLMDLTFNTASESFKNFLSVVPKAYTSDFSKVKASGSASVSGVVKGRYSTTPLSYPAFDIKVKIVDGFVRYPGVQDAVSDIFADIRTTASKPDYKDVMIDVPTFRLKINKDFIDGNLYASNLQGNGKAEGKIHAVMNLANIKNALPVPASDVLQGALDANLAFNAKIDDINKENYSAINFLGNAVLKNFKYKSGSNPTISAPEIIAEASPQTLQFKGSGIQAGRSDFNLTGSVSNPLAYFSTEKSTNTKINIRSVTVDINEWMDNKPVANNADPMLYHHSANNDLLSNATLFVDAEVKNLLFKEINASNLVMKGSLAANKIDINTLSGYLSDSDFNIKGVLLNAYDYFLSDGILAGNIQFKSTKFDLNPYMTTSENTADKNAGIIPVPANINITAAADIAELTYTNLKLKNFRGKLEIKNCEVALRDVSSDLLGGKIALEGLYNTEDLTQPNFAFKLDLNKLKYADAFSNLHTFSALAPIAGYLDGIFNTTLIMKGNLGSNMLPEIASLDVSGFIETLNGRIKGFKPLNDISEKLGLNSIRELDMNNTRNWFEIQNGYLEIKPFDRKIGEIDLTLQGRHGIGKEMDYKISMDIPREMLRKNAVISQAESGLSFLEKEAAKLGINIQQGDKLHLLINITGKLSSPGIKITPLSDTGKTAAETLRDVVTDRIDQVKEDIRSELNEKEKQLRDTVQSRVDSEIDKARSKAEQAADKAIDSAKTKTTEIITQKLDTITKGILTDTLSQKAKDVLGEKAGQEVEKIKDKLKDFNPFKKKGGG
jgi:hypothetical protein